MCRVSSPEPTVSPHGQFPGTGTILITRSELCRIRNSYSVERVEPLRHRPFCVRCSRLEFVKPSGVSDQIVTCSGRPNCSVVACDLSNHLCVPRPSHSSAIRSPHLRSSPSPTSTCEGPEGAAHDTAPAGGGGVLMKQGKRMGEGRDMEGRCRGLQVIWHKKEEFCGSLWIPIGSSHSCFPDEE